MNGKIYFVSAPGRIKIGYTKKPEARLKQLRQADMEELTVIAITDGTMHIEHKLHDMVRPFCIRGEWFQDCQQVRAVMNDFLNGAILLDRFGEEIIATAPGAANDFFDNSRDMVDAAIKESLAIAEEIGRRIQRREDVSDLAKQALFLAEHIIGPALHGWKRSPELKVNS